MEFSLDSLDGFPVDSDILEASEGHVTNSPTTKILSPKPCVKSRDQRNTVVSNQGYHSYGTSTKTKESEGRIDTKSQTLFDESKKLPEAKTSLGNSHKYQTSSQITNMRSPSSTPETTDFATTSQQYLDHRQSALKLDSNCATYSKSASQTDCQKALVDLDMPTRGDNFVGGISHHCDLSPWERWVIQKACQEREKREGKRLSNVSRNVCICFHGNLTTPTKGGAKVLS